MGCNVAITPEVRKVLDNQTIIEGNILRLTGQLDRKLYEATNKILELLGGKWNRSAKGHIFKGNPREAIEAALEGGSVEDIKKKFQLFETPAELAMKLAKRLALNALMPPLPILEPSAGTGRLADAIRRHSSIEQVHFCEIQPELAESLKSQGYTQVGTDFLKLKPKRLYQRILMNPPFTRGQDAAHVMHAYEECLEEGGRLIAIMSSAVTFNTTGKYGEFHRFLTGLEYYNIEELPEGTFKESGTCVRTVVVEIIKRNEASK